MYLHAVLIFIIKVNKDIEIQVLMNISKREEKKSNYPILEIGDNVRVSVINKV